nr:hypothetical protein [Tanacetum cinerariifolium]
MSTNAAGTKADIESKHAMSTKAPDNKHDMSTIGTKTDTESNQDMSAKVSDTKVDLFLDQLQVDVIGIIVVMIGSMWDVSADTGRYLSMNFVVSDAKGPSIRVTLWGGLEDVLIENKTKHVGMCPVVLTSTTTKYYNRVEESLGSSMLDAIADTNTPKLKRVDIEVSNTEDSSDSGKGDIKDKAAHVSDKKIKEAIHSHSLIKDYNAEVSCGSAKGTSKDKGGSHSDKKKQKQTAQTHSSHLRFRKLGAPAMAQHMLCAEFED